MLDLKLILKIYVFFILTVCGISDEPDLFAAFFDKHSF